MKKTKFNPELLKEELNRFKMLENYNFYSGKQESPEYEKPLLLGNKGLEEEEEEAPKDLEPDTNVDAAADKIAADLGVDDGGDNAGGEDNAFGDTNDTGNDTANDAGNEPAPMPEPAPEPESDDVEVDVTSLVKGSEEAKKSADIASKNTEILMKHLQGLEAKVAHMAKIGDKIENLEKEIVKRNPTPVEKLEMRSLDSYPYSQKLSDYWADKEGAYDVMGNQNKKKEYVLTKDDVNSTYSDSNIKKSFAVKEEDINPYDEENI